MKLYSRSITASRRALLAWYDEYGRDLPWRLRPAARAAGTRSDPYQIWLSEIMLQQTSVAAVRDYYAAFLRRWPTVQVLAAAPLHDVLSAWAGLGYYARARNLHACAKKIVDEHQGLFPQTEAGLRALPGIGDYTAAAIAAIAYDQPCNVVDGNVERVMARLHTVEEALPKAKPTLKALAANYVAPARAADWPQALMDLGSLICRPKNPNCPACPLLRFCAAGKMPNPDHYPLRATKTAKPVRYGAAFVLMRDNAVLLRRRPPKGLLGAMSEVPGTPWTGARVTAEQLSKDWPLPADWRKASNIEHIFTHFALKLDVYVADAPKSFAINEDQAGQQWWAQLDALDREALPSVMRKVLASAISAPT